MARTRTSDPGRVTALHYAATPWQRHAKRLVYAYSLILWSVAPAWTLGARIEGQAAGQAAVQRVAEAVPCVECQAFSVPAGSMGALPEQLGGTRVLVRTPPGAARAEWEA